MTEKTVTPSTIVFFDFDATLAQGDSLCFFLRAASGWPRFVLAIFCALGASLKGLKGEDKRTLFKKSLLFYTLQGKKKSALSSAINKMQQWPRWIDTSVKALKNHHQKGHHIVIASGSLDLYLHAMLKDLPYHAILCTKMEIQNDVLTGKMLDGNCVREKKAHIIEQYMKKHGPFEDSWAYGNAPHDLPMMEKVKNKIIV